MHTRRHFVTAAAAGIAFMLRESQATTMHSTVKHRLLIGTSNTSDDGGAGKGIYVADFQDGVLSAPLLAVETRSPGFLATAPHGLLYAQTSPEGGNAEAVSYRLEGGTAIHPIDHADAGDPGGCHIGVSRDGRCVFVANYSGGNVASFAATKDGKLRRASFIQFPPTEHGPVASRQEKSHAHSAITSPDGNYVLVNDLGLDRIHVFRLDHATAQLMPHTPSHWSSAPGAGPRHLACHPNGKWIYCINEVGNTVDQLLWNATDGTLRTLGTVSTLPTDVPTPGAHACELVFAKDLRFLYASNRTYEGFAVFALDAATGSLTPIQHIANPGKESRHLAIDPSGRWFLSANQFSGDVSVFPIDTATGMLGERKSSIQVGGASCLLFA
ncbi:MAG: lactonase family protein [Janthinobacterium lividum]